MCLSKVCLMQRTTYSVSASVSCTGSDDLKSGPRLWNSGIAASCSTDEEYRVCESLIVNYIFCNTNFSCANLGKCLGVMGPTSLAACLWQLVRSLSRNEIVDKCGFFLFCFFGRVKLCANRIIKAECPYPFSVL